MFTRVTAAEWGRHGVRINCVAPGLIESERPVAAMLSTGVDPAIVSRGTPLRRNGRPEDIANAIHFLVSDAASYITGHTLLVDGGPPIGGIPDA
jgi:NAD(P)-dependent dehydrogenase (short-subunit alcohol dehydrogenase family)